MCEEIFSMSQFHKNREIVWKVHVDESPVKESTYYMIMCRNLLHELEMIINFQATTVLWENSWINIQELTLLHEMDMENMNKNNSY